MFIVFEGLDGCGKTVQARMLEEWLLEIGRDVLLTAEPTDSKIGIFIREILSGSERVDPTTLAFLFTADRYEHIKNDIEPALMRGKIVISERYYHSTIAYQSAQGVDRGWLTELNSFAIKPDLTIFLDVKPKISAERTETNEIFENEEFLNRVYQNYLEFDDIKLINGNRSKEDVFEDIKRIVSKML